MRLIDTTTIEVQDFINDNEIPPYAILSHTWGNDEVTLQALRSRDSNPAIKSTKGYDKIIQCCRIASENGLRWAWVDTCCIDKTSSAELSEAINSMYRWYRQADICYIFLSDLTTAQFHAGGLSTSRWFTRGWTLQEMIAPKHALLFSAEWERLSTKAELQDELESITSVPKAYLSGVVDVTQASISMRMSWAADRQTSRSEDIAYCLLGLFDINIPLIYGEGKKAFRRLQEELIRTQPYEHTIYAWGVFSTYDHGPLPKEFAGPEEIGVDPAALPLRTEMKWDEEIAKVPLLGLLADSPSDFQGCGRFVPTEEARDRLIKPIRTHEEQLPTPLHGGIRIQLHTIPIPKPMIAHHLEHPPIIVHRMVKFTSLLVRDTTIAKKNHLIVPLILWQDRAFGRKLQGLIYTGRVKPDNESDSFFVAPARGQNASSRVWRGDDIIFRWHAESTSRNPANFFYSQAPGWDFLFGEQMIVRQESARAMNEGQRSEWVASWPFKWIDENNGWSIVLHRLVDSRRSRAGALAVSLLRTLQKSATGSIIRSGCLWYAPIRLIRCPYEAIRKLAACSHVFWDDVEVWRPVAKGLPKGMALCVETMWVADGSVSVNVVDFRFPDGEGDEYVNIPRAE